MISIALVGYGYWGPNVARQLYNNPEINFPIICDKRKERLDAARKIYIEQVKYLLDYNEILNNKNIDAVALAVETSAHFQLAKQALAAGKHIYIEKPFTSTVAEAIELKSLAEKAKRIIHIDHIMMYHPFIQKIKEWYDSGEIGNIVYFDASRMNLGQIKEDVNAMWDLAIHDLSILDYLFNPGYPDSLYAIGHKSINKSEVTTFLLLKYNNFIANIKSNWFSPVKERKLIIAGTKKMVVYDDVSIVEKLKIYDSGLIPKVDNSDYNTYAVKTRTGDVLSPDIKESDALYNSINHFVECIKNKTSSLSNPDQGIRLLKILEEADKQL
ncbi:oxidoreductase [Spirochaetia bacterium]|nr:oxidoreductase [Spirochaetia bacterium]